MTHRAVALSIFLLSSVVVRAQSLRADLYSVGALSQPVAIIQDPTDPNVQFILQQGGSIRVSVGGTIQATSFLTIPVVTGSERGLLGMCFDPNYASNHYFYVNYTAPGVYMQLSRFTTTANPLVADPQSELHILRTLRPFTNHNSGTVVFGPDGLLYIPTGDGGSSGDPGNRAQNPNELLGKMLRIDPHSDDFPLDAEANYHVPADNPFVDGIPITARTEIWAFGYRNPWKFSFDDPTKLGTGAMVIGDVGQDAVEEVDYEPPSQGGRNYGWSFYEGNTVYNSSHTLAYTPHTPPVHTYTHAVGQSITGGYIYRGLQLGPEYFGRYFFADYVAGKVWSAAVSLDQSGEATFSNVVEHTPDFAGQLGNVSSFGVDPNGELFAVKYGGAVYRIVRPNTTWLTDVDRTDGLIISGQVRSLIALEGKVLQIAPFTAVLTTVKSTGLLVGLKTNVPGGSTINVNFVARVSQNVATNGTLSIKNWTTGQYDPVTNFTLTGAYQTVNGSIASADHVRPADGRIEFKSTTLYGLILMNAIYRIQYDTFAASVQ